MWGLGCLGFAVRVRSRSEKPGEPTQVVHPNEILEKSPTARPLAHLGSSIFRPMSQSPALLASGTPEDCDKAMAALPPSPPRLHRLLAEGEVVCHPRAAAILEAQIVGRFSHLPRQRCPLKPRARPRLSMALCKVLDCARRLCSVTQILLGLLQALLRSVNGL